jgi:leader peptidase (prepilin peptidase)/N-methyltransferase
MADWGVVGLCAAGGLVTGPPLDRLARTVRRPAKKAAPGTVADPSPAVDTAGIPDLTLASVGVEGTTPPDATHVGPADRLAPSGVAGEADFDEALPPPAPGAEAVAPAPTWASVGRGSLVENVAAAVSLAALEGLAALRLGAAPALGAYGALMAVLVCLAIVDFRTGLLPRRFVYAGYLLVAVGLVAAANVSSTWHGLLRALIGGAAAFAIFYVIWFVYPKGMGFGDVRLSGLLGMALGWLGWRQEYIGFLAACVLGSLLGVAFLIVVKRSRAFPFGPALAAGAAFGVLWGGWLGDLWFHPR